jgi:hypothetical protein
MEDAIKTVRIQNWKWTKQKAVKFLEQYKNIISKKYPDGLESEIYFVPPGYEHVTRDQPIIRYNPAEGNWEITTKDLFKQVKD